MDIEETYKSRTKRSKASCEKACKYLPYGVGSTFRYFEPYPFYVDRVEGVKVIDVDGNEYIDFNMNYGAQLAGHTHPKIVKALEEQIRRGTLYTMPHNLSTELAKELVKRFPIDKVRFTNSGTETTMHAVRLARGYTGKDKIIKLSGSYHGVHDCVLSKKKDDDEIVPSSKGVPAESLKSTLIGTFNDLDSIKSLFDAHKGEVAGAIVEPVMLNSGTILPEDGFLHELLELCHQEEAVLILDEVKTGVKLGWGGACEYFDIEPDIICLAKSIGGGVSIGAFGARDEIMSEIKLEGGVTHAGTYNANPLVVAAGVVTLREVLTRDVYEEVFRLSKKLAEGYESIIDDHGLSAHVVYAGPCGTIYFTDHSIRNHKDFDKFVDEPCRQTTKRFFMGMLNQGILPHPVGWGTEQWTISIQHTDKDIDKHLEAFDKIAPIL
jgi:glutamate-1-semialdehyde 2,1-aminomutase